MTTLGKAAVAGAICLAALTVYSNVRKPAPAPVKPATAEVDLLAPGWQGWKLTPVKPAPAPLPLPAPVAQPIQRPAHDPAPARKRAKPPIVAKHVQVKPPAPVVLPPPPPPPAPATWSDTLFGHAVDRTDER